MFDGASNVKFLLMFDGASIEKPRTILYWWHSSGWKGNDLYGSFVFNWVDANETEACTIRKPF